MDQMNNLKERLKKGGIVVGPWCTIPSSILTNVITRAGMDFVIIDMEHSVINFGDAEDMMRAAKSEGCSSIVRIGEKNELFALKALDSGADGVMIPHIESAKDAQDAVSYTKYYPLGRRGFSPYTRAGGYSPKSIKEHAEVQNNSTMTILLIEGKDGIIT